MSQHHETSEVCCQAQVPPQRELTPERHAPDRILEVGHVALDIAIDLEKRSVAGTVRTRVTVIAPEAPAIALDAVALTIESVSTDGRPAAFSHDGERLVIRPPEPWKRGEEHAIEVTYHGRPERGLYFIAPDAAYPDKPLQAWSQGQDEDGRFWFPCIDHPSQKMTTEMRVAVPRGFEAISNGRLVSREDRGQVTQFHWVQEIPHVTYLVSLVVGQFDVVEEKAGKTALRYFVPKGRKADARRTFGRTPRMVAAFERLFGHPYPYPKYDQVVVSDFIFGGMENTSATVLYEYVMLDETVEGVVDREDLISHELAHQWFGDLITCNDWSHAWLNEGFATYAEILWYEHGDSPERAAYHLLEAARLYFEETREEYRRPIVTHRFESPVEIFDRHLYQKAACVLHHLRHELSDEVFFRGLRRYVSTHARGLVETHDLRRAFEIESGRNLDPFFEQWIHRAGHPELDITHDWDEATRRLTLTVKQTQDDARSRPYRFRLPCRAWLARGAPAFVERTFEVSEQEHSFVWTLDDDVVGLRAGQGGMPLVKMKHRLPDAWLKHQLDHDEDLLGRIEAALKLGKSATSAAIAALALALPRERTWMGQVEIAKALGTARGLDARDALIGATGLRDPRSRASVAAALGQIREDEAAAAALERLLEQEQSPIVRASAYRALGVMRWPGAPPILTQALWEPSWNEVVGRACLGGLGILKDPSLVPLFVNSVRRGEQELRRVAAVDALAETSKAMEAKARVREQLEVLVRDPSLRVAQAAVAALRSLLDAAAIPALEAVAARRYGDPRLRSQARAAIRAIVEDRSRGAPSEVFDRIDRAEAEIRKLRDRVSRLQEQRESASPGPKGPKGPKAPSARRRKAVPANPPRSARMKGGKRKIKRRSR